jgi:signal transduction histidine kinase
MPHPIDEIRAYLDFDAEDEQALRRLLPGLPAVLPELVDDFYRVILAHPDARAVLADDAQIARLKLSLADWVTRLLSDPFDRDSYERIARIGRRHVEVGLPQRFMPLAMSRIRQRLVRLAVEVESRSAARRAASVAALDKAIDLALTTMLETYAEMRHDRVRQSERLAAVGDLAARVGHELKNPLGVINTSLLLIEKHLAKPDAGANLAALRPYLDRIGRGSKLAARLSSQFLDFTRRKQPQPRTVELESLLREVLSLVDETDGVSLETNCQPAGATAIVDPGDVTQVLVNLARNSVQAIRESGTGSRVVVGARRDAVGVHFSVSDDGPGIPPENAARIFEPLFTTRPGGTGLGLAIARDLVEAHGGRLTVASTPGRGAQFTVVLPQETRAARR